MDNKFLLFAYVTLCIFVVIVGLYLGQAAHTNCSKCNYVSHAEQELNLAKAAKR